MATQATQTSAQVIGFVRQVIGEVKATGSDGVTRTLQVGDLVFADDLIVTGELGSIEIVFNDGGDLTLGRNSQGLLDADVYQTITPEDGSEYAASIDAIQQAILLGEDPTAIQEAPAAGEGESAAGDEGTSFVTVERTGTQTTPESGFETNGLFISFTETADSASLIDLLPTIDLDGDDNSQAGSGYLSHYTENSGPLPIADADIQVSNPDGTILESARIVLTNAQDGDQLDVSAISGLTAEVDGGVPGVITVLLSGSASPEVYAQAIRNIGFINTSENPDETPRIVEVTVNDGDFDSNTAVTTITVQAVNDPPVVDLDGDDSTDTGNDYRTTFTEGDTAISIADIDLSVSDVDDVTLQSATVTLTNPQSDDVLAVGEMPAALTATINGSTITISGEGTLADYQSAINAITFENTSENPSAETRVVEVTVNDGELDSDIAVSRIEVVGVNDVAVIDLDADDSSSSDTGYETTYIENQAPVTIVDDDVVINDVDDEYIESATIELTNYLPNDHLVLGLMPIGITAEVDGSTVTLTGSATLADYQQALQAVYFANTSENPPNDDRIINITLNDGDGNSNSAVSVVHVIPVNDPPDANNDLVSTPEDTPVRISVLANDTDPEGDPLLVTSNTQPANGTLTRLSNGTYEYTPNPGFTGTDSFNYTVSDGNGGSDRATVSISVAADNDGPVAVSDSANTNEDTPIVIDVLSNDSDPEGDVLSITSFTQGANGSVTVDPVSGNPVYTPNPGFTGTDSFNYTVSDGNGGVDSATVTVNVAGTGGGVNTVPDAADDAVVTDEDIPVTVNVLSNDSDPDGDVLTVISVTQGANGSVTVDPVSGNPVYTPNPDFNGTDTFTYTVDDGNGGTDTAIVTVTVGAVNDAPVATDDAIGTDEDTPVTVDVLPNDSDPDGDTLTVSSVTQGINGSVAIDPVSGNPVYTPNPGYNGTDSFTYTIEDGNGGTDTATVTVTVGAVNDAPVATDDAIGTDEDTPVTVDVLPNDSDPDGDTLTVTAVTQGANGSVTIDPVSGNPVYTPDPDFNGTDTFTYTVDDGNGGTDTATVTVTVGAVNDAPIATDDTVGTNEDTPVTVDVLPNDSDPDGDTLTVVSVTQGANGAVTIDPVSGNPVYTPNPDFNGTDTFTYTVDDGNGGTDTATVIVTVGAVNDAPVATDDAVGTNEDTPVTVDVLPNDSDPDGDTLTVTSVTQGTNGTVTIDPVSGNPIYTPNPDFNGSDSFTYTVDDGNGGTDTATVTVTVGAVNDAPFASDDSVGTNEDTPVTVDVLPNDSDPDGDALTVVSVTQGVNGAVTIDPVSGNPVYTPNPDFNGTDTFTYTVDDGNGGTDTATVTVTVAAVNDAPLANNDTVGTDEDTPVTVDVLPNDSDPDGDALTVTSVTQGTNGTVTIDPVSGNPVYTPNPDFNGTDTFTYTVDDGNGGTDIATVTVTVGAVNDAPVATDDTVGTNE
ncbi:MAG: retention module-containing protein, partial [Candidatus Thiodiazotropha sp.]